MSALADFVKQRVEAGILSARAIHAEIIAPSVIVESSTVQDEKTPEQVAFERRAMAVAGELVALVAPQVPEAQRLAVVANMSLPQIAKRISDAKATMAPATASRVADLVAEALALFVTRGAYNVEWPPVADIGQDKKPRQVITRTAGPAIFEVLGVPKPTVDEIREMMR